MQRTDEDIHLLCFLDERVRRGYSISFFISRAFPSSGKKSGLATKISRNSFYHLYFCVCGTPGIGKIAYDQVHLTVFQKLHAAHGGAVCDLDPHSGIILMKSLQVVNQKVPADGIACPDPQLPLKSVFLKKLCLPLGKHFQGRFDMLEKYFSLGVRETFLVLRKNSSRPSFFSRALIPWLTADWEMNSWREASEKLKVVAT